MGFSVLKVIPWFADRGKGWIWFADLQDPAALET